MCLGESGGIYADKVRRGGGLPSVSSMYNMYYRITVNIKWILMPLFLIIGNPAIPEEYEDDLPVLLAV